MKRLDTWLLAPAPAQRLAMLRILIGGFVLVYLVGNVGEFARSAAQPSAPFEPVGVARVLDAPLPAAMVWTLFALLLLTGAAFIAGFWFRVTGVVFAALLLGWSSYHSSWGQMLHFEHLFTMHIMVLALAPSAATLSLDADRDRRLSPDPSTAYGWPIRLMAIVTVITYVLAAVTKIRRSGMAWLDGSNLGNHIAYSATRIDLLGGFEPPLASFVVGHSWLLAAMAIGALAVELLAPAALVGGRIRTFWVAAVLFFHLGTAATMMVWFPYQGLGFAFLPLFFVERVLMGRRRTPVDEGARAGLA